MGLGDVETLPADSAGGADAELPVVDPSSYELGAELARGGFGRLIRARDRRLDRVVAIKQLRATNAQLEARFRLEARLTARLAHPAIVPVHEVGRWPSGEPFYAMKLVTGRSLRERLDALPALADRLALLPQVTTVVDAIAYAHREHVLHRDLKPSNIMLGDTGEAYVVDWGLAKDLRSAEPAVPANLGTPDADLTSDGAVLGTPPYLSPEQARGDAVDERADVYSLGALLYEVVAGAPPYTGDAERVLAAIAGGPPPAIELRQPAVPRELAAIIARAMARAPADRYPTARQLADDLHRFARGELVSAYRYSVAQRAWRWTRRHRTLAVVALAALAVVVALAWPRRTPPAWRPVIRELAPYEENGTFTVFLSDGEHLAFDSDRDGQRRIYIGTLPLDDARPVTSADLPSRRPRADRDGNGVLYAADEGVRRAELDGTSTLVLPGVRDAVACGDGFVIVRELDCPACEGLAFRDAAGRERVIARLPGGHFLGWFDCDRAGERIVFSEIEDTLDLSVQQSLWIIDRAGGTPRQLLDSTNHISGPRFHPDGHSVLVSSDRGGARNIWEVPVDGGEPVQITFGAGPDFSPAVSPDGRQLVFHVDVTSVPLFEIPLDGGTPRRLTPALDNIASVTRSPDGRMLAYQVTSRGRTIVKVRTIATGEERTIAEGNRAQFSGDGRDLVFARGSELYRVSLAEGVPRRIAKADGSVVGYLQDLPEGIRFTVLGPDGAAAMLATPDGRLRRIAPAPYLGLVALPDGGQIAVVRDAFEIVPPGGAPGDPANAGVEGLPSSWRDDPLQIYYIVGDDDIWRYDVATRRREHVLHLHFARDFAISPDGKMLYAAQKIGRIRRTLITNFGDRPGAR
ncbi:MAG TPA: protein kinase [Kofleriaceae bacterium]|nr:protein kinase [Kofleriaceae bacterium]